LNDHDDINIITTTGTARELIFSDDFLCGTFCPILGHPLSCMEIDYESVTSLQIMQYYDNPIHLKW